MPQPRTPDRTPRTLAAAALAVLLTATVTTLNAAGSEAASCPTAPCDKLGTFTPVTPTRILDGRAAPEVRLVPDSVTDLKVTGVAGVPATGVSAVVLNLTVDRPTAASFFAIAPTGGSSSASSLNFAAGESRAAAVTVKVGTGDVARAGKVSIYNAFGEAYPIVDIQGYFATSAATTAEGSTYVPLAAPRRVVDTRTTTKLTAGDTRPLDLASAVPAGATAVVANLTVTNPTANGFLTAFKNGAGKPVVSNLNWTAGRSIPNLATVPLDADRKIAVFNSAGSSDVLVDVAGYYVPKDDPTLGNRFTPVDPNRLGDSRSGKGGLVTFTGPSQTQSLKVTGGTTGVPTGVSAVVVTITSDNVTSETFFTAYPAGSTVPEVSNLNPIAGENAANQAIVKVGTDGNITLLSRTPSANIIVDVYGYFKADPTT